jgi:hypothetical protein
MKEFGRVFSLFGPAAFVYATNVLDPIFSLAVLTFCTILAIMLLFMNDRECDILGILIFISMIFVLIINPGMVGMWLHVFGS